MKHECEHNSRWFMGVTGVLHRDTTSVTNNIDDCSVPCVPVNRDSVTDCVLPETEVNGNGIQPSSTYFNSHLWLSYCDLSSVKKGQLRIIHKMSILAAKCQMASVWLYILKGALCSLGEEISIRRDLWVVLIDRITFMPKQLNKLILKDNSFILADPAIFRATDGVLWTLFENCLFIQLWKRYIFLNLYCILILQLF